VLDGSFTSVKQAIGIPRRRADADTSMFLERFVAEAIASGLVSQLIAEHGVKGRLSVASHKTEIR
jgi:polar amino acid transport system substrate-binding protein